MRPSPSLRGSVCPIFKPLSNFSVNHSLFFSIDVSKPQKLWKLKTADTAKNCTPENKHRCGFEIMVTVSLSTFYHPTSTEDGSRVEGGGVFMQRSASGEHPGYKAR
jgi:hypothetical protein